MEGEAEILTPVGLRTMRQFLLLFLKRRFSPDLGEIRTTSSSSESDVGVFGKDSELDELGRRTGRLGMENGIAIGGDDDS